MSTDRTVTPRPHSKEVVGVPDTCPTCRSIAIREDNGEWLCERCREKSPGWMSRPSAPVPNGHHLPAPSSSSRLRRYTDDELVNTLKAHAVTLGRTPSERDWVAARPEGAATIVTYRKRFGSWPNALHAAGLTPNPKSLHRSQPASDGPLPPAARAETAAPPPPPPDSAVTTPAGEAPEATLTETPASPGVVEAVLPQTYAHTPVRVITSAHFLRDQQLADRVDPAAVEHPAHYTAGGIETIDVIEQYGLSFHLGNVVKYVLRHDRKGGLEDLHKARWYLDRYIAHLEGDV